MRPVSNRKACDSPNRQIYHAQQEIRDRISMPTQNKIQVSQGDEGHNKIVTFPGVMYPIQIVIIAQVYRLSAVHCQMTRYSQRVPGYLTRYSVSANEISFDNKISQSDCVFQIRLGMEENYSPLHLVISIGFLKAYLENYSKYDIEMCRFFFKWHQSGP